MKNKIVSFLSLLLLPILFGSYIYISGNDNHPDIYREISKAAADGLQEFVKQIPEGYENAYGFNSKYEINNATVGNVYEIYTISPEFLKNPNIDKHSFAKPVDEFRVEVTYNDEVKTFITVSKINGLYKAVDLGGAELSKEFSKIISGAKDNSPRRIIFRLYQLQCDFLATSALLENIRTGGNEIESFNFYSTYSSRKTFSGISEFERIYSFKDINPQISEKYSEKFSGREVK